MPKAFILSRSDPIHCGIKYCPHPSRRWPHPQSRLISCSNTRGFSCVKLLRINSISQNHGFCLSVPRYTCTVLCSGSHDPGLHVSEAEGSDKNARTWSAVGLIVGTAVGPGILGLPASLLKAGLIPSTLLIIAAWLYVMASVLLVVELTYGVMKEQRVVQVSFTGLATHTLGKLAGLIVSVVYGLLNYALLVACISGLASLIGHWLPFIPQRFICLLCPMLIGLLEALTPFVLIDGLNRVLCVIMIGAIGCLVGMGLSLGRNDLIRSLSSHSWAFESLLAGLPVIVLTLGFHVITPLVCKVVGGTPQDACKAVLLGSLVPLLMVLSWNMVVLGLAPSHPLPGSIDPIGLLLSVSSFAAPAVQAFAFCALGTTLIGYVLSFPKQLIDAFCIARSQEIQGSRKESYTPLFLTNKQTGINTYSGCNVRDEAEGKCLLTVEPHVVMGPGNGTTKLHLLSLVWALGPPTVAAAFYSTAFVAALNFAGVYANCFLFGVLPPLMAYTFRYGVRNSKLEPKSEVPLLPGGKLSLLLLFCISLYLGTFKYWEDNNSHYMEAENSYNQMKLKFNQINEVHSL